MKIEIDLNQEDGNLVSAVFSYLEMVSPKQQSDQYKKIIMAWVQKWLYEMARKAKDKSGYE